MIKEVTLGRDDLTLPDRLGLVEIRWMIRSNPDMTGDDILSNVTDSTVKEQSVEVDFSHYDKVFARVEYIIHDNEQDKDVTFPSNIILITADTIVKADYGIVSFPPGVIVDEQSFIMDKSSLKGKIKPPVFFKGYSQLDSISWRIRDLDNQILTERKREDYIMDEFIIDLQSISNKSIVILEIEYHFRDYVVCDVFRKMIQIKDTITTHLTLDRTYLSADSDNVITVLTSSGRITNLDIRVQVTDRYIEVYKATSNSDTVMIPARVLNKYTKVTLLVSASIDDRRPIMSSFVLSIVNLDADGEVGFPYTFPIELGGN